MAYKSVDLRGKVPGSPVSNIGTQAKTKGVVWHWSGPATAVAAGRRSLLEEIKAEILYQMTPGLYDPGFTVNGYMYSHVVWEDTVYQVRNSDAKMWHCADGTAPDSWNYAAYSIHVPVGEGQKASPRTLQTLAEFTDDLLASMNRTRKDTRGHLEISSTSCPGPQLTTLLETYRQAPMPAKTRPIIAGTLYRVRTGSFTQPNNAANQEAALRKAGFTALVIPEGTRHNVYAGSFAIQENATALKLALGKKGFPAAVIPIKVRTPEPPAPPQPAPAKPGAAHKKRIANTGSGSYVKAHPTHHDWRPDTLALVLKYEAWWPDVYLCTYYKHPPIFGRKWEFVSYDVWDKQGRGYALDRTLGWRIVKAILADPTDPPIAWIIYDGQIWTPSAGWQPYNDFDVASDAQHKYHIHVSHFLLY